MENKRIQYMDIAKGIGICLVVLCHAKFPLNHYFTMFYLPMFFFVSGFFYSKKDSAKTFILKKVKGLYCVFVMWGMFFLALRPAFFLIGFYANGISLDRTSEYVKNSFQYGATDYLKSFVSILLLNVPEQLMRPLWFLGALFLALVLMKLIDSFVFCKIKTLVAQFVIILALYAMGYLNIMPGYISQAMVAMLFCWLGWKSREKRLINKLFGFKLYNQVLIFILCATICFIASLKTDLIMMTNTYTAWWTMLISSVSGICMTMLFCGWISDTKIGNIFSYVGQRTLTILPLHMISFKLVNYAYMLVMDGDKSLIAAYPIITNRFPWWVLYSAVGLLIPLAIDWIKQKVEGGLV